MDFLDAIVLGLVEGITEFLPISSTGHLILASELLGLRADDAARSASDGFVVAIQGGAILAVLVLYRARVASMIAGLVGRDRAGFALAAKLLLAFLPAAALGLAFEDAIAERLFAPIPVLAALALGGLAMILHDRYFGVRARGGIESLTFTSALMIGLCQATALWPGVSRALAAILGGILVGLSAPAAAEFSFLLGLITLSAATGWKVLEGARGDGPAFWSTLGIAPALLGGIIAALSAFVAVRWMVRFLAHRGLAPFGYYRLGLATIFALLLALGWVDLG